MKKFKSQLRSVLLNWLLLETKSLFYLQKLLLSCIPIYIFQLASFIGTHSFYLSVLPLFFWVRYPTDLLNPSKELLYFARVLVLNLAAGVCITCYFKDYLSLPRPNLQKRAVVKYHSKEFGCPSTHSANATSISLFLFEYLSLVYDRKIPFMLVVSLFSSTFLVISSRIALGMHGFLDIFTGMLIGIVVQVGISNIYDNLVVFLENSTALQVHVALLFLVFIVIYFQPKPLSYCPCYIDSICFISVVAGVISGWYFLPILKNDFGFELKNVISLMGFFKRSITGVSIVLTWKTFWGFLGKRLQMNTFIRVINYAGIGFISTLVLPFLLSKLFPL